MCGAVWGRRRAMLSLLLAASVASACAPYRRVAPEQRDLIAKGRCMVGGESQGLVVAELGGMARGIPLGGVVVEHVETGRKFAIALGRVLALLPAGRYRLLEWYAADKTADTMYRGTVKTDILTVAAGKTSVWGRLRLLETEDKTIALAFSPGERAIQVGEDGAKVVITWSAGDKETIDPGRCLGTQKGAAHTDTAAINGLTVIVGGGVGLLSGDITDHGSVFQPRPAVSAADVAEVGGVFQLGMGWSFGTDGFPLHEIALTFAWAGFGLTSQGKQAALGDLPAELEVTSGTLIGLHGAAQYLARPGEHWIASPIVGVGTGVAVANLGNIEPAESDPDLAWSLQLTGGVDVRVTEDLGVRAMYVFAAPLVGKSVPLTHQFVVGISILAGGDLWW